MVSVAGREGVGEEGEEGREEGGKTKSKERKGGRLGSLIKTKAARI